MKNAIKKVQLLQSAAKHFQAGNYSVTLRNIQNALLERSESSLSYADKQLCKIFPIFAHIKRYMRHESRFYEFLRELYVERFQQHDYLFQVGDVGRKMYFVLEGVLQSYNEESDHQQGRPPNKEIFQGDYIGEVNLHHRIPRTSTVLCKTDITTLVLTYDTYGKFVYQFFENRLQDKSQFLKDTSLFQNWSHLSVSFLLHHLKEIDMPRGYHFYLEGDKDQNLYIIKFGEVEIFKKFRINNKFVDRGVVALSSGQCFGDYELINHFKIQRVTPEIVQKNVHNVVRETYAKTQTQSSVYVLKFTAYFSVLELIDRINAYGNPRSTLLRQFFDRDKSVVQNRLIQIQKDQEHQDEIVLKDQEQKLIKPIVNEPPQPKTDIIRTNKMIVLKKPKLFTNFNDETDTRENFLKEFEVNIDKIKTQTGLPNGMKFDRNQKILLYKKIREHCNIDMYKLDTQRLVESSKSKRNIRSSYQNIRNKLFLDKREIVTQGSVIIKNYNNNSKVTSPNQSTMIQTQGKFARAISMEEIIHNQIVPQMKTERSLKNITENQRYRMRSVYK